MEEEKKESLEPNIEEDKTLKNGETIKEPQEDIAKKIASLEAQKEHWRNKYDKVAESIKDDEPEEKKPNLPNDRLDVLDFSDLHRDINREEVIKIQKYASALGVSMEDAYKDDFIQAGIEKRKKTEASENAGVNSNRSPRSKAKSIQYKQGMSKDEFKKLLKDNNLN